MKEATAELIDENHRAGRALLRCAGFVEIRERDFVIAYTVVPDSYVVRVKPG